jgi:hypothetical protein
MPRYDEQSLRRPGFAGGEAIVLGDGQSWSFPRPVVAAYRPVFADDGTVAWLPGHQFGPEYDALADALDEAEDSHAEITALARLARHLLAINYDLPNAAYSGLLPWVRPGSPAHEANAEMWRSVAAVALGVGPKPSPVG